MSRAAKSEQSLFDQSFVGAGHRAAGTAAPDGDESSAHTAVDGSKGATCLRCGKVFSSVSEQRAHFASASHAAAVRGGDRSRDAATSSSSSSDTSADEAADGAGEEGTPLVGLHTAAGDTVMVWKSLFPGADLRRLRWGSVCTEPAVVARAAELAAGDLPWIVALLRSGRFAAGVWRRGDLIAQKTLQRYTTRRKQGGAQSKRDSATGGGGHTAGSRIRRYNEEMLQSEVRNQCMHAMQCNAT